MSSPPAVLHFLCNKSTASSLPSHLCVRVCLCAPTPPGALRRHFSALYKCVLLGADSRGDVKLTAPGLTRARCCVVTALRRYDFLLAVLPARRSLQCSLSTEPMASSLPSLEPPKVLLSCKDYSDPWSANNLLLTRSVLLFDVVAMAALF